MTIVAPPPSATLREQVRQAAHNRPGTYRMIGEDGEVLYVGKSKAVRTRLLSYFRAKEGEKAHRLVREAARVECHYEPNEFAALLRELELIKRFRPRYNVRYRRDALYSFLKLAGGAAPRLFVVRQVGDDAATYFGPFRGGRRIAEGVRELNDVLGLRDCPQSTPIHFADQAELFPLERPPRCHRYDLKLCSGPCAGGCTAEQYLQIVDAAHAFLNGEGVEPLRRLEDRMTAAVARWDFEHAASLRERVLRLELLRDEFRRLREALESLTFRYTVPGADGDDRVYLVRRGSVRRELPAPRSRSERLKLDRIAREIYETPEADGTMVSKRKVEEILLLSHWFRTRPAELKRTAPPEGKRRLRPAPGPPPSRFPTLVLPLAYALRLPPGMADFPYRFDRSNMKRWLPLLLVCLSGAAACGGEAESAVEAAPVAAGPALNPWDTISPESLYGATPVENLRVTPVELDLLGIPPGWEGMRIAAISDLQLGLWSGNEAVAEAAVAAALASNPDIVVLLGDYLAEGSDPSRLSAILAPLRGTPSFAVLGDRDVRTDTIAQRVTRALTGAGIHVLSNSSLPVGRGGDTALIAGASPDLIAEPVGGQQWILSQIGIGRPMGLLLAHNPVVAAQARGSRYPAALAGNTFCGTVGVQGTPRLSWVNTEALPGAVAEGAERLYRLGNMVLFITCGTGYGFVPIRFGAPPEVALITLRSVLSTGGEAQADTVPVDTLIEQYERSMADTAN